MPASMLVFCAIIGNNFELSNKYENEACSYVPTIIAEAENNDIEPELLIALIMVESGFQRKAVSPKGACGLTQVMPRYSAGYKNRFGKKLKCKDLLDPKVSIKRGAKILAWWIKYHKGNVSKALCGYNAGFRCKVTKNREKPHKAGMRYSRKVLKYKRVLDKEKGC